MRTEAIFLNGVYKSVLEEILQIQAQLPEHIMFLQPYKGEAIVRLRENPPSVDDSVQLLMSLTEDLPTVHYVAEIVGWDDKRNLSEKKRRVVNRLICTLQPREDGIVSRFAIRKRRKRKPVARAPAAPGRQALQREPARQCQRRRSCI
jgi:hypothetical protein